ncbi:hypothetical protein ACNVED_16745 (plasmid) [Legionella sp. D16C41]|uniref:hypothetical protein n=1 Tax=Legionella sp. D16C41 TaxID=3402688 RepID=UPI003AF568D6
MKATMMVLTAVMILMSGCSTMNDKFGCNQTAGDTCLTIDEVHAMTEPKGTYHKRSVFQDSALSKSNKNIAGTLWIAPHKNTHGGLIPEHSIALNDTAGRA